MAKQASKTIIGSFVVSAIILLIIGVVVFGGGKFFKKTIKAVMFFEGSVKGLNVGAPVLFRGVKIGAVENVVIQAESATLSVDIPVIVALEPDRFVMVGERLPKDPYEKVKILIARGIRAQMTVESLVTGQLMIEMDFHPDEPVQLKGLDVGYPELPTMPSDFELLAKKMKKLPIEQIFGKMASAMESLEKILSTPELMDIVHNFKAASEKLNTLLLDTNKLVAHADGLVVNLNGQVNPLSTKLQTAIADMGMLMDNLDGELAELAPVAQEALSAAKGTLDQASHTLKTYEGLVDEKSGLSNNLNVALGEITEMARSLKVFFDYLEQHPEALLQGKGTGGGQ